MNIHFARARLSLPTLRYYRSWICMVCFRYGIETRYVQGAVVHFIEFSIYRFFERVSLHLLASPWVFFLVILNQKLWSDLSKIEVTSMIPTTGHMDKVNSCRFFVHGCRLVSISFLFFSSRSISNTWTRCRRMRRWCRRCVFEAWFDESSARFTLPLFPGNGWHTHILLYLFKATPTLLNPTQSNPVN